MKAHILDQSGLLRLSIAEHKPKHAEINISMYSIMYQKYFRTRTTSIIEVHIYPNDATKYNIIYFDTCDSRPGASSSAILGIQTSPFFFYIVVIWPRRFS